MTTKKATILLLALSMMWGSSFVFSSMAMEQGMAATDVVFIRFFLGTILLYLVTYKRFSIKNIEKTALKVGISQGVLTYFVFIVEMEGIARSTATNAGFITATNVVILPFLYLIIYKEKPKALSFFAGIATVVGVGFLTLTDGLVLNIGDIFLFITAILYAYGSFNVATKAKDCSMVQLTFVQFVVTTVLTGFTLIFTKRGAFTPIGISAVVYLAIVPTGICFFLKNYLLKFVSPVRCAIVQSTQSVFCAVLSVWLLGDIISGQMLLGMAIIFIAILLETSGVTIFEYITKKGRVL